MSPANELNFELPDLPTNVPEALMRSFKDTIRAYNARIYGSTATSGRRTLEGIFKHLAPEELQSESLFELIKHAERNFDFAEPLKRLSNAIRSGGNLGAHFDFQNEPDAKMARQIVELLSYLIEYMYVLPNEIEVLEAALTSPQATRRSATVGPAILGAG